MPGSISSFDPSPVQAGQAPCGELNEKLRGSSSSTVKPSYGQLYFSLYRCSSNDGASSSRGAGAIRTTPSPEPQRGLDRVGQPAGVRIRDGCAGLGVDRATVCRSGRAFGRLGVPDDVAVDDDLDRVALVLVELGSVGDVHHLAIDADADEALPAGAIEDPVALGLAVLDQRAEDEEPRPFGQRQDLVDDLLDGLALDRVTVGAVRDADAREQQPQVVVDLGDRPDRRARVARRALLVDRDGRRQPVDLVDVRLLHLAEELARVRAQALDVTPLALGIDGVEREAGLAMPDRPVMTTSRSRGNAT